MNWIVYSLLMFIASNVSYLAIRKAQLEKIDVSVYSIFIFFIPALSYLSILIYTGKSLNLSWQIFVLIVVAAFFWSYLGNYFSQQGILNAPNPGYSLILSKSYVILTTIAAVFLFDAELTWRKMLAILIILGFAALISISKEKKELNSKWVVYSLLAFFCWGFGSLISKYFLNLGLSPPIYLFYIGFIVSILNFAKAKAKKVSFILSKKQWFIMLVAGVGFAFFNLSMQFAYQVAPNIGYVAAINISSIMSVTLFSALLYKDSLSLKKIIGIVGVIIGLIMIL